MRRCLFLIIAFASAAGSESFALVKPGALDGCVTGLERVGIKNISSVREYGFGRIWRGSAWRNERVHMPFVVWGGDAGDLRAEAAGLKGPGGALIPITLSWVGEVIVDDRPHGAKIDPLRYPPYLSGDILDTAQPFQLTYAGYRAVWASVKTPADAAPGLYGGDVTVSSARGKVVFRIELEILAATLPKVKKFHLDIWQTPWSLARYYGVKPFSPEHYAIMEPYFRELADAGQKAITVTITDYPWNIRKNIDSARTMVKYVKRRDGTYSADFSVMDEFVAFAEKCGIGPQIHCYAPVKFEQSNTYQYIDEATGEEKSVKLLPGTAEYEAYWSPLLVQLDKHISEKGWRGRVYLALDELPGGETAATAKLISKYAPSVKFHMSGNRPPEMFEGIAIDGYSQMLGPKLMSEKFLGAIARRKAEGRYTTLYTCCLPFRPNALPMSPLYEQRWIGLYIAAKGFDGYLKSTFFRWVQDTDPLKDTHCYPNFPCGDSFLVYPGMRLSLRWQSLVDGIEDCEKINVLREAGAMTSELDAALSGIDLADYSDGAGNSAGEKVSSALAALEKASRRYALQIK